MKYLQYIIFHQQLLHQQNILRILVISYHCAALELIFGVYYYVSLQDYNEFLQIISLKYWGDILHEGDFLSRHVIHVLVFQKYIIVISLWENICINPRNILIQHETLFLRKINSIIYCTYWTRKKCSWWLLSREYTFTRVHGLIPAQIIVYNCQ